MGRRTFIKPRRLDGMKSSTLIGLLRELHTSTSTDGLIAWATNDLASKFGTDFSVWTGFDTEGNIRNAWIGKSVSSEVWKYGPALQSYLLDFHAPLRHFQASDQSPLTARLTDFTSQREFESSPLYEEAYRHMGSRMQLSIFFRDSQAELNTLSFGRNGANYSDAQLAAMTEISHHLQVAYDRLARIEKLEKEKLQLNTIHFRCINNKDHWYYVYSSEITVVYLGEQFGRASEKFALPDRLTAYLNQAQLTGRSSMAISGLSASFEMTLQRESDHELSATLIPTSPAIATLRTLTARETEVLNWISQGKRNEEIATILGISRSTACKHVENILRKLGCETRTAAAAVARDGGSYVI